MQAQIETILPQSQTWQFCKDCLLVPLLVMGGLVTVIWNVALLAVMLRLASLSQANLCRDERQS